MGVAFDRLLTKIFHKSQMPRCLRGGGGGGGMGGFGNDRYIKEHSKEVMAVSCRKYSVRQ